MRLLELVYPFFLKCCEYTDDIFGNLYLKILHMVNHHMEHILQKIFFVVIIKIKNLVTK